MSEGDDVRDAVLRRGIRLIRRSLRAHPIAHGTAMLGANLYALAVVLFTVVVGRVTDELIVPSFSDGRANGGDVLAAMAAIVGVAAIRGVGIAVRRYFLAMATFRTQRDWRQAVIGRYLNVPLRSLQARPAGELLARADSDIEAATSMLQPLAFAMSLVALVLFSLLALLDVHPYLALVGLVLFPALALLNRIYTSRVEPPATRAQAALGRVSGIAHESFDGVMVVKTLGREAAEIERFATGADALRTQRIVVGRLRSAFEPALDALPNLGVIAVVAIGANLVGRGDATVGEIVRGVSIFLMLAVPIRILGFFLEEMPRSVVALDRIDTVLAWPDDPHRGHAPAGDTGASVAVRELRFAYDKGPPVLDGLSMAIDAGSSVAIVGSTGCGKSTLVSLLARLIEPGSGSIQVGDQDIADLDDDAFRSIVVPVFQESFLFADSVLENLTLGAPIDFEEVRRVAEMCRADEFINELGSGYDTVVGERGVTLSGGQRQRIALARALLRRPRVLLLDDATSAVDPRIEAEILANLRGELDTTLIVVAYRLATIRLADHVVYLAGGRVAGVGSHDELLALDDYAALVRAYETSRGTVADADADEDAA